jgi:hypothetical protein
MLDGVIMTHDDKLSSFVQATSYCRMAEKIGLYV